MIAHEAISPNLQSVFSAIGFEPIEVKNTIRIRLENTLAVIAPLGNGVREACSDSPGDPWHGGDNRIGREKKSRKGRCPEKGAVPTYFYLLAILILLPKSTGLRFKSALRLPPVS
jgi:hypothetical protein